MDTLTRAETEWTQWRYNGTLPGIMATLEDGGRELGFWVSAPGWGYQGRTVTVYAKGRNGQTTASYSLTPDETRRLADSLRAMADAAERQAADPEMAGV